MPLCGRAGRPITVAIGRGAGVGVLFKGGEALGEPGVDTILLDPPSTITQGRADRDCTSLLDSLRRR